MTVAVVGRLYCDLIFTGLTEMPALGRERFAPGLTVTAGGGAFNAAAWLKHLGVDPLLVSDIGDDPFSAVIARAVDAHGIDRSLLRSWPAPLPRVTVAMPFAGDRAFLSHVAEAERRDLTGLLHGRGIRWLHLCEISTLVAHPELIELARETGATLSVDPSWDDALLFDPDARRLLQAADILLPNEEEARALTGLQDAEEAAQALSASGATVVMTRGTEGAQVVSRGYRLNVPTRPAQVVDTTGAGDAFNAGVIAARLRGFDWEDALREGTRCGAEAVGRTGGAPELTSPSPL